MPFEIYLTVEERDKHGHLKYFRKSRANSPVRALIDWLFGGLAYTFIANGMTDTGGLNKTVGFYMARADAGVGVTTHGIRVGTGTNAVAIANTGLQTPIAEGAGDGLLNHGIMSGTNPATVGTSRQFTLSRILTNNGTVTINVTEVAIYVYINGAYFCFDRSLNSFTINAGTSKTVTYTIKVTV